MAAKKNGAVRALIKDDRASLGLSQSAYSRRAKIHLPTLQRWEAGTASPGGLMTARLIKAGVPVDDLIEAFEADLVETDEAKAA